MALEFKPADNSENTANDLELLRTMESKIVKCFNDSCEVSIDTLKERLPSIPEEELKKTLTNSRNFFETRDNTYTHFSKINFDEAERKEICSLIKGKVATNNFVSLTSINALSIVALNPEFSEATLKSIIFDFFLSGEYARRGNIVTLKGSRFTASEVLKDHCATNKVVYFNDLNALELDVYGKLHGAALMIGNTLKFRVDLDTFIPITDIQFDVEATDTAINSFIPKDIIPLQAVTSFASFPSVEGYPWSWFLLESYCRHYSKLFKYQCLAVNSCHVGAIFKKACKFPTYQDVLAHIIVNDSLSLDKKYIGEYFFENKYVAFKSYPSLDKTIELARSLYKNELH
jgi:hypothetical protein